MAVPAPPRTPARGRPRRPELDRRLLEAAQEVILEVGVDRLTLDAVAARAGASKATIHRRWPTRDALVLAAVAASQHAPSVPDTGDLRSDLVACTAAFLQENDRSQRLLACLIAELGRNPALRRQALDTLATPYQRPFQIVIERAVDRHEVSGSPDTELLALVFPAIAFLQLTAAGVPVDEAMAARAVDAVLLPALGVRPAAPPAAVDADTAGPPPTPHRRQ